MRKAIFVIRWHGVGLRWHCNHRARDFKMVYIYIVLQYRPYSHTGVQWSLIHRTTKAIKPAAVWLLVG